MTGDQYLTTVFATLVNYSILSRRQRHRAEAICKKREGTKDHLHTNFDRQSLSDLLPLQ